VATLSFARPVLHCGPRQPYSETEPQVGEPLKPQAEPVFVRPRLADPAFVASRAHTTPTSLRVATQQSIPVAAKQSLGLVSRPFASQLSAL